MTSRPSMNRSNSSCSGLTSRGLVQHLPQTEQLTFELPGQSSAADLASGDYETCDANRVVKRQKLDLRIDVPNTLRGPKSRLSQTVAGPPTSQDLPTPIQAGRPFWTFQDEISGVAPQQRLEQAENAGDEHGQSVSCPPLPMRPWRQRSRNDNPTEVTPHTDEVANSEVQTVPFCIEVPEAAPKFDSDKPLDFFPWTGTHPEDMLTDQTAKQGFYDRVQVSQNESNTARPSLYTHFKHRSGLKLLSSVFTAALDKRQSHCKITAFSTFRPPPRVTLTDIKREAWLRDLANPAVPLRKLSRTIPHGIRGKILLDQCVNKGIPIGRAVWLAKCVGANEIRAFKRKGTSAAMAHGLEVKWVRDWSFSVQQFVEGIASTCGAPNWALNMAYVLRLAARLFQEQLLDQDMCLDWFLQSLNTASIGALPVWLSMLGTYWRDLIQYRKRGRQLAESLLAKLKAALILQDSTFRQQIVDRLSRLVKTFAESHPTCFVLPLTWRNYRGTLNNCFRITHSESKVKLDRLFQRNERVTKTELCRQNGRQSSTQRLLSLLNDTDSLNDIDNLSSECLNLSLDFESLTSRLLEWASTKFGRGPSRIYVAVRLLRKWRKIGIDIDSHIVTFLQQKADTPGYATGYIYHIVSELVRSQSFAVSKYLQQLMARGAVTNGKPMHADVQLLTHLPCRRLPSHVWNLRNTLLTRAGFSVNAEIQQVLSIKHSISGDISDVITEPVVSDSAGRSRPTDLSSLSWTVKSEVGHWIREHVALHRKRLLRTTMDHNKTCAVEISALTPTQFLAIRDIIEGLGDLSLLADILKHASSSDDAIVLISAADTLHFHIDSFKAIGASADLFRSLLEGYSQVRKADHAIIELISSLLEAALKLPNEVSAVAMLRRDLCRFDRKSGVAVSSPVSEHPTELLNVSHGSFPEVLNQWLNSSCGIDETSISRIFDVLTGKLQHSKELDALSQETARYLSQLRIFNPKFFDGLMLKWIISILKCPSRPCILAFLPSLVGVGCVTLHAFFTLVNGLLESATHRDTISEIPALRFQMVALLCLGKYCELGVNDFVSYRFKFARKEYVTQHAHEALGLVNKALMEDGTILNNSREAAENRVPSTVPLLCELMIENLSVTGPEGARQIVEAFPNCVNLIHQALDVLLGLQTQDLPGPQKTQSIVELIDDFSLPYCLIKLQLLLDAKSDEEATRNNIVDLLFKTAESDVRNGERRWLEVLNVLPVNAAQLIRQRAERELLGLPLPSLQLTDPSVEESALVYLRVVDELSYSIPDEFISTPMSLELGDKLLSLLQKAVELGNTRKSTDIAGSKSAESSPNVSSFPVELSMGLGLYIILRLVALHRSSFSISFGSKAELNHQTRFLIQISCITRSPLFASRPTEAFGSAFNVFTKRSSLLRLLPDTWADLQLLALDVCSALVDTLPDEARYECARFLRDKCPVFLHPQNDPRLLFLLGPIMEIQPTSTLIGPAIPAASSSNLAPHLQPTPSQVQSLPASTTVEDPNFFTHRLRFQQNGRVVGPFPHKPWEMLGEAAPIVGINDTPVNLAYFGTRQTKGP